VVPAPPDELAITMFAVYKPGDSVMAQAVLIRAAKMLPLL